MNIVPANFSKTAVEAISKSIIEKSPIVYQSSLFDRDEVEIVIVCEPPFNLREFISYLRITDRIYGRLLNWNLSRYSHLPAIQLEVTEVRFGSFEIVTAKELANYITPLAILWLVLKYLPDALKTSSEAYKNWKDAKYRIPAEIEKLNYEAIKLSKEAIKLDEESKSVIVNRKKLEIEMRNDELLMDVEEKHLKQIPQMIKEILSKEIQDVSKARSFAIKNVKKVKIQRKLK